MGIPESQLETWAKQGAITTAKSTADSVKNALTSYEDWPKGVNFEVYLQGSYKNDTNIRGDSDVDVVAQLNSIFFSNLTEDQKKLLGLGPATYHLSDFRKDVLKILTNYYGQNQITEGNKSIKVQGSSGRLPADAVVCSQYRKYRTVNIYDYIKGMCFWSLSDNRQVINYPKIHYDNGVSKHQRSDEWYKPVLRMFKNCRGAIRNDATPSYFLECLLYNVPDTKFGTSYGDTFCNIVNWLNQTGADNFVCQNEQLRLFGSSPEQWNTDEAKIFVQNLISLWNNW